MKKIFSEKVLYAGRRCIRRGAVSLLACTLGACATSPHPADSSIALQGSDWHLAGYTPAAGNPPVEVQRGQVVFTFGSDGRLSAKLDCNRGVGSYTVAPEGPSGGSLHMGPLGVTRMMCPDGSPLGAIVARDIEKISSYRMSGNTLVLSGQGTGTYVLARAAQ